MVLNYTCECMHTLCKNAYGLVYIYIYIHIHMYIYICIHAYIDIYIHTYTYIYIYTWIYLYIHMHIYVHKYIYICICTYVYNIHIYMYAHSGGRLECGVVGWEDGAYECGKGKHEFRGVWVGARGVRGGDQPLRRLLGGGHSVSRLTENWLVPHKFCKNLKVKNRKRIRE